MAVITISRQVGSGGTEIAAQVCTRLGYRYLDKWLLSKTAAEVGLSEHEVVDFSEDQYQARTFLEALLGPRHSLLTPRFSTFATGRIRQSATESSA